MARVELMTLTLSLRNEKIPQYIPKIGCWRLEAPNLFQPTVQQAETVVTRGVGFVEVTAWTSVLRGGLYIDTLIPPAGARVYLVLRPLTWD